MPHAWEITPIIRRDDRGFFLESYRADLLAEATGRTFDLRQGNVSSSRRGVARGIHYADVPDGQAKYFMVTSGSVTDFVVDLRVGSPTFGQWDAVELDADNRRALFISEGLGHLFIVTSERADVSYLVNEYYNPPREHSVSPLDPAIGLELPIPADELVFSAQDASAPTLAEAQASGILPGWADCLALYERRAPAEGSTR